MRFYLDNDVDVRCRDVLTARDHDCWTAADAGRSDAEDDDQTVYADDQDAVLITHDREFTERRKRNTIGRHVRLCIEQPDGPEVLARFLEDIVPILERRRHVVVEVRDSGISTHVAWS